MRVCARAGCGTVLSRYNNESVCQPCDERERVEMLTILVESKPEERFELLVGLKKWAEKHGRSPSRYDMEGLASMNRYRAHFGTWSEALKLAGLKPARAKRKLDRAEMVMEAIEEGFTSTAEIAVHIGATEQAVYNALYRLKKKGVVTAEAQRTVGAPYIWQIAEQPESVAA